MQHTTTILTDSPTLPLTLAGANVHDLPLLTTIAAAFAVAWVLGLITQKLKLSPIVGYLLAGVVIGPYTPGYTGDVTLASQLAEVGVILLMFGVGLHFHLKDLLAVKDVAIPGALGQSLLATLASAIIFSLLGFNLPAGITLGIAMAVASTVVLLRVLLDQGMLNTSHGHVAVGWLIVEDILTVILLVLIPLFALSPPPDPASTSAALSTAAEPTSSLHPALAVLLALGKLALMVLVVFVIGSRVIPKVLNAIAKLRSSELFTLTVLVLSVAIAVGSAALFGTSVALGAFLAGMVVAQSKLSHQAAADALPMRHAFAVIFFVSIGMLLNPRFLIEQPLLLIAALAVVLIVKPLAALAIVAICGYPVRTALTVALGLAQIGEFSFIVGQAAVQHNLMPESAMQILVAAAIVSITINPLLFRSIDRFENALRKVPKLYNLLSARHARRAATFNATTHEKLAASADSTKPYAVIAGYGPVGRLVDAMLRDANFETLVIDMNVDTVQSLTSSNRLALFGDATQHAILEEANLRKASHLIITHPSVEGLASLVVTAREINPTIEVIVRARYLAEGEALRDAGATYVVFEERRNRPRPRPLRHATPKHRRANRRQTPRRRPRHLAHGLPHAPHHILHPLNISAQIHRDTCVGGARKLITQSPKFTRSPKLPHDFGRRIQKTYRRTRAVHISYIIYPVCVILRESANHPTLVEPTTCPPPLPVRPKPVFTASKTAPPARAFVMRRGSTPAKTA